MRSPWAYHSKPRTGLGVTKHTGPALTPRAFPTISASDDPMPRATGGRGCNADKVIAHRPPTTVPPTFSFHHCRNPVDVTTAALLEPAVETRRPGAQARAEQVQPALPRFGPHRLPAPPAAGSGSGREPRTRPRSFRRLVGRHAWPISFGPPARGVRAHDWAVVRLSSLFPVLAPTGSTGLCCAGCPPPPPALLPAGRDAWNRFPGPRRSGAGRGILLGPTSRDTSGPHRHADGRLGPAPSHSVAVRY